MYKWIKNPAYMAINGLAGKQPQPARQEGTGQLTGNTTIKWYGV
ncbi:hypothetical protein DCCM_2028 [Desulfocucumis palustris]|uniref:Uncharacterized protein n=1 Tax=Desulfocucumis palustris TaxID=1898651 RepID=A0A2L2XGB2_9FIRM|nr:hypothetical protein DCCM_2028 [Desulfocucumis palustris]